MNREKNYIEGLLMLCCSVLFKFVHLCSVVISNYKLKYTLEYYSVTPLSTVLLLLLLDTFTVFKRDHLLMCVAYCLWLRVCKCVEFQE